MSLQQSALRLPEGGEEWTLAADPGVSAEQPALQDDPGAEALEQQPTDQQQPVQPPALSDLERVALGLGWTPQDRWRGDPNKWTPAADYIATTGRVLERTKTDLRLTRQQTDALNARLARLEHGHQTQAAQRAQELFEQYEDAKFEAGQKGDAELYRKLTKEQQEVMARAAPEPDVHAPTAHMDEAQIYAQAEAMMQDPVFARLAQEHPVILQSEDAWNYAQGVAADVKAKGGTHVQAMKAVAEAMQFAFDRPVAAQNGATQQHHSQQQPRADDGKFAPPPNRRPAPPITGASHVARPAQAAATAVDRLPVDARAFMDAQVKAGKVKDQETWAKAFLGETINFSGARK